ncbi:MAG: TonB-dependent receptor plug domain-containing protein, partial [Novosphingobium sp.]|nr:TonB-dependent receptor plug domain-containing protein [Novosphingobium sp.]
MRTIISAAAVAASLCYPAAAALADEASGADGQQAPRRDIVVVGEKPATEIDNPPATAVETTAEQIATTTNAVTVEDTIKYFPSLIVRRRHIGDIQAPIATRTSGLGSSARSLIFADGAPLSTLIGNNNGSASPRWGLVTPEEIDHVEVLYGPFSAAYSGSSIGTVVNIVTRMPDKLEARLTALQSIERFSQYGTDITLPATQLSGSIGDRFGPLALFASATRTIANGQPLAYITAASAPAGTSGAFADLGRTGAPIKVLGAGGLEHHVQDTVKLKAALDLGDVA